MLLKVLENNYPRAKKNKVAVNSFAIIEQNTSQAISSIMAKLEMAKNVHLQISKQMPFAKQNEKNIFWSLNFDLQPFPLSKQTNVIYLFLFYRRHLPTNSNKLKEEEKSSK